MVSVKGIYVSGIPAASAVLTTKFCYISSVGCIVDFLGRKLDDYVSTLPVLTYVERMGTRSGLIRARLRGAIINVLSVVSVAAMYYCVCGCGFMF